MITEENMQRYARHIVMPEIGKEGQEKLKNAKVIVIGMGGLGSAAVAYLAAAGIGTIGIVDFDSVDSSNLQRQVLYKEQDVGKKKIAAAKQRLNEINSDIRVIVHDTRIASENASDIIKEYDVVIDGTDNPQAKYAISDACVRLGKPDVSASARGFEGHVSVFGKGCCYRCLFPRFPDAETCSEAGVLGALVGALGCMQAVESIKIIIGMGRLLAGRMLVFDALNMEFRTLSMKRNPDCSACQRPASKEAGVTSNRTLYSPQASESLGVLFECNGAAAATEITAEDLNRGLGKMTLIDVREPFEHKICRIEGAKLMPMKELSSRLKELNKDGDIVLYCHRGNRSAKAAAMLQQSGFRKARSLSGGIDEWAKKIDKSMKRY